MTNYIYCCNIATLANKYKFIKRRHNFRRKRDPSDPRNVRVNERIRIPQVRVIGNDGKQLGVMSNREAQDLAKEQELDLIEIVPVARPPVCKIMDYGSFKYQKMKDNQRKKKAQKKRDIKGVQLTVRTAEHDLKFKASQADKFLAKGHPVRVEMRLRGREKANIEFSRKKLKLFTEEYIQTEHKIEQEPKRSRSGFTIIIRAIS